MVFQLDDPKLVLDPASKISNALLKLRRRQGETREYGDEILTGALLKNKIRGIVLGLYKHLENPGEGGV